MTKIKASLQISNPLQHLMEEAYARFELDCKQACRGLKVSVAVTVFGIGTLIPNNFAHEDVSQKSNL